MGLRLCPEERCSSWNDRTKIPVIVRVGVSDCSAAVDPPWLDLAIAAGVGLMIRLDLDARRPAGIWTFTLAALLAAVAARLVGVPLLGVATVGAVALDVQRSR